VRVHALNHVNSHLGLREWVTNDKMRFLVLGHLISLKSSKLPTLVEKGSLVQHIKTIYPGSARKSGPMTSIGPGSCHLVAGPGSFWRIGPGLWHEPGPMPPQRDTWLSAEH
jgi:hypothetical protein